LKVGDRIEVPKDSRVALALTESLSVRLDRGSAAVFVSADRLALERGAVYVQSSGTKDLRIETTLGAVQHVGTRFEVRLDGTSLRVRVREGSIALERGTSRWIGTAGEGLTLAEGRPPERQRLAESDADWAWVGEIAEPFALEGATLRAFLDWVSREQGWQWQVDDPRLRARLDDIVLHGSIDGLSPQEALDAVLPASALAYRRDGARLILVGAR
jgi:ferric-dicitrate binding protein FerR (iron transport regulator)